MDDYIEIEFAEPKRVDCKEAKVTDANMTPNEYIQLLACRAQQLKYGAPPKVEWEQPFDPILIAKNEIRQRLIPLEIVRKIPDSFEPSGFRDEIWSVADMNIRDY